MKQIFEQSKLKDFALTPEEIGNRRKLFDFVDTNKDGQQTKDNTEKIDPEELKIRTAICKLILYFIFQCIKDGAYDWRKEEIYPGDDTFIIILNNKYKIFFKLLNISLGSIGSVLATMG